MAKFNKGDKKRNINEKTKDSENHGGRVEDKPYTGRKEKKVSGKHSRTGTVVYGLRGRKGQPENVERVSEDTDEYSSTTRFIESSLGTKSYAELAPYLAKGVERVMAKIMNYKPDELIVTSEFICKLHEEAFGELFPSWAGKYRDRTEGRFLSIHPFLDFNGRVIRMLLFALLYRLDLPPVQLVPDEKDKQGRTEYFAALSGADNFDWQPLIRIWEKRLNLKE